MIKSLLIVAAGAAVALEADRQLQKVARNMRLSALTGGALDKLNEKLESR